MFLRLYTCCLPLATFPHTVLQRASKLLAAASGCHGKWGGLAQSSTTTVSQVFPHKQRRPTSALSTKCPNSLSYPRTFPKNVPWQGHLQAHHLQLVFGSSASSSQSSPYSKQAIQRSQTPMASRKRRSRRSPRRWYCYSPTSYRLPSMKRTRRQQARKR
ncbi:hypothetical protein C8F01DRAFT_1137072, partial [Mycena amicta]